MFRPSDQPVDGVSTVTREQVGGRGRHHLRPSHHVCWWSLTILTETSVITPIPINDLVLPRSYIEMSWKTFTYHYSIHQSCLLYLTLFCFFRDICHFIFCDILSSPHLIILSTVFSYSIWNEIDMIYYMHNVIAEYFVYFIMIILRSVRRKSGVIDWKNQNILDLILSTRNL